MFPLRKMGYFHHCDGCLKLSMSTLLFNEVRCCSCLEGELGRTVCLVERQVVTLPAFERKWQNFIYGEQVQCKFCILKLWLYELEESSSCSVFLPGCSGSVLCHACSEALFEATPDTRVLLIMALALSAAVPAHGAAPWACCTPGLSVGHLCRALAMVFSQCPYSEERKRMLWFLAGNRPNMVPVVSALREEAVYTNSRSSTQPKYLIGFFCKTSDQVNGRDWQ